MNDPEWDQIISSKLWRPILDIFMLCYVEVNLSNFAGIIEIKIIKDERDYENFMFDQSLIASFLYTIFFAWFIITFTLALFV